MLLAACLSRFCLLLGCRWHSHPTQAACIFNVLESSRRSSCECPLRDPALPPPCLPQPPFGVSCSYTASKEATLLEIFRLTTFKCCVTRQAWQGGKGGGGGAREAGAYLIPSPNGFPSSHLLLAPQLRHEFRVDRKRDCCWQWEKNAK